MHGGVKFYRGAAKAARTYVERDCARYDDYYLAEGDGIAMRFVAEAKGGDGEREVRVEKKPDMDGETYEGWVAGIVVETGQAKGRLRKNANGLRFVEVTINGPKTWSLAAALNPEVSAALDAAQESAAQQIISYLAKHATTRVGPRDRQVQVPVEHIEAAVIRHYTSRAGDPHRHLHLQINARVFAKGAWRGLHSVGVRDMIEAINGIGHAAVATDPEFLSALAEAGFTMDPETGEIRELAPYVGAFSARTSQIRANVERYEAEWRAEHPGEEPGPRMREVWDRRAWAQARPDKAAPEDGAEVVERWNEQLRALGYIDPHHSVPLTSTRIGDLDREAAVDLVLSRLGAKRSAWNAADIRGQAETLIVQTGLITEAAVRIELAEDLTARTVRGCTPLLLRPDVPEHVRSLTSMAVLAGETEILERLLRRSAAAAPARMHRATLERLSQEQGRVAELLCGRGPLVVVEGAAGAGKTTTLAAVSSYLAMRGRRLLVVTPTLKAAEVAVQETGADGRSAAWLIHQHGWRWDDDGHWTREPAKPSPAAQLRRGDLLLIDEAGMVDQDTALALLTIADETGARVAFMGDRHQLPAVGRGGVLDHAIAWVHPSAIVSMQQTRRFADPEYAKLSLAMRDGRHAEAVFDLLVARGQVVVHASEAERTASLAIVGVDGALVVADTREHVARLSAAIRTEGGHDSGSVATDRGELIGLGDRVATRRNDPGLGVTNRQIWTVVGMGESGSLVVSSPDQGRDRELPPAYVREHVELAYATTIHGAQGETIDRAHVAIGEATGAAAAYVAMTRGRQTNVAHLVAESVEDARKQWVDVFSRDRADLGPAHARGQAIDAIDRYGPAAIRPPSPALPVPEHRPPTSQPPGIGF
ncbi:relaxase domain-containing protein [Nocardioides ganghwensis]|uniref:AAA family ATPase n=1 Tax=Nocardioides ganghwensis TaxID=252230 RepID=A0A4Q2S874_9ACTN|nr:relaxase domain-containing protein [Nocardioides ganghwensis]RYB99447.1 AAA family ATPase [Nocardioides ganghwensis]